MTTTLNKLLAEKQALFERLQAEDIGPAERDEIERLLENVEAALTKVKNRKHPAMSRVMEAFG